jgi:hypothetical protein
VFVGNFAVGCGPGTNYPYIHIFQCMLERTQVITKEVLEIITLFLAYPTVFHADNASDSVFTDTNLRKYVSVCGNCAVILFGLGVLMLYELFAVCTL